MKYIIFALLSLIGMNINASECDKTRIAQDAAGTNQLVVSTYWLQCGTPKQIRFATRLVDTWNLYVKNNAPVTHAEARALSFGFGIGNKLDNN
jgi:hypothetical protein